MASTCSFGNGQPQLVISKLSPSGTVLYTFPTQVSTAVSVSGMAVGPDGSVFLTGSAYPKDLATTAGAYVSSVKAAPFNPNAFVVEVNAAGSGIKYATFLDNAPASVSLAPFPSSAGVAIAVDSQGDAYVTGSSDDSGFPTSSFAFNPACNCSIGNPSIFLVKLNGDGSNIFYSTFLVPDRAGVSAPQAISVNSGLQATITEVRGGGFEFSTTRLDEYGTQLLNYDAVTFDVQGLISLAPVAPDGQGNLLFSGAAAASANLPISAGAFSNGTDFVALVRIADGSILYATRLPSGSGSGGVLPDGSGGFLVVGATVGKGPIPSTQFTRLVPASLSTPAVLGVANVAGLEVSAGLAPGEVTSIYGTGLGPRAGLHGNFDSNGHLPESLGGTEVYFNGVRAPLLYAGDQQINAIVPFSVRSQKVSVVVIANSKVSNRAQLPAQVADPEIFKANNTDPRFAFAVNEDGGINSAQNPAKGGSVLTLYVSGAGLFSPAPEDGTRGGRGPRLVLPVTVNVSFDVSLNHGSPQPVYALGEVLYAGSAPTLAAGVLQINVQLPVEAYVGSSQSILIDFGNVSGPLGPQQAQGAVWIAAK